MVARKVLLVGAVSTVALAAGGLVAVPMRAVGSSSDPVPVTQQVHTPDGSDITITHAKLKKGNRLVKATVTWHKALRVKQGQQRHNVRVVAMGKAKKSTAVVLSNWSSSVVGRRSQVRFWLTASQVRKVRAANAVVLSASQQYDSPKDRDRNYERNYVSTLYLKGSAPPGPGQLRDCSGVKIEPGADLSNCNLIGAYLAEANLRSASVTGADLRRANLASADLTDANLTDANLTDAFLPHADLPHATLTRAKLPRAVLTRVALPHADLTDADLTEADLTRANLIGANLESATMNAVSLRYANLIGAILSGAKLRFAHLDGAHLDGAVWSDGRTCATPSVGRCD